MKTKKLLLFIIPFLFLLCSCGELNSESSLGDVIWTIVGWIVLIAAIDTILDMIINYFAIRFPYVYFPICLIFSIILFSKATHGEFAMFGSDIGLFIGHAILLFMMIPRPDDFTEHYTRITYEYDTTFGDFFESSRKDIKHTISGAGVKLVIVGILLFVLFGIPVFIDAIPRNVAALWIGFGPLIVEAGFSGIYSLIGIHRLIKYHR